MMHFYTEMDGWTTLFSDIMVGDYDQESIKLIFEKPIILEFSSKMIALLEVVPASNAITYFLAIQNPPLQNNNAVKQRRSPQTPATSFQVIIRHVHGFFLLDSKIFLFFS